MRAFIVYVRMEATPKFKGSKQIHTVIHVSMVITHRISAEMISEHCLRTHFLSSEVASYTASFAFSLSIGLFLYIELFIHLTSI